MESSLWYMRLEGGRYRFTTEPNLNKVVVEREGAISDDQIETLIYEAVNTVGGAGGLLRVVPGWMQVHLIDAPLAEEVIRVLRTAVALDNEVSPGSFHPSTPARKAAPLP
jgi:hypothetical protein